MERFLTRGGDVNVERAQAAGVKVQASTQHRGPVITHAHMHSNTHTHTEA